MKIIIREWLKDKKACAMMLGWLVLNIIYTALNSWVVILISNTLADFTNFNYHLTVLLVVCGVNTVISMIVSVLRPLGVHHCFSTLNEKFADKVIDSDVTMFTKYSCAYINTMSHYIFQITSAGSSIVRFINDLVRIIITLVTVYIVGGRLVIPVVIVYFIGAMIAKKLFSLWNKYDEEGDKIKRERNQELENIVNGFMEVRSFSTQEWHRDRMNKFNGRIYELRQKRCRIQCLTSMGFELNDTIGLVITLVYAARKLAEGVLNSAEGMSLVMLVFRIIEPMSSVMDFLDNLSQDIAMAESYMKIVNFENKDQDGTCNLSGFTSSIELKDVSFAYDDSSAVLNNINMTFKKGQKIGICGVSGAGKSTLFKLLNRFYDPTSGTITVDGTDMRQLTRKSYRKLVSSVHQDNTIFPGTIRENVLYGNFNVPEYEMVQACKKAKIYDFIMSLDDKFETQVGPRGLTLSGGQKQRIALARLFLSNPEVILLDEATSALDNESEGFIQEAIDKLEGKTIITIAHRLSTIRNSDVIYVMGPEGVLESGSHEELMRLNGVYASMNR